MSNVFSGYCSIALQQYPHNAKTLEDRSALRLDLLLAFPLLVGGQCHKILLK
ncbi:MAG: hypothetical protein EZS28_042519, partial [Streblomastix strix]